MNVAVACDHGGFILKEIVIETIKDQGHAPIDLGTFSSASVDYPDYAEKISQEIHLKRAERAVLICGSGIGACIAANKFQGIYAGIGHDTYSARQGVEHDNMNVLCLGARIIGSDLAREVVKAFLSAQFLDEPRFIRRFHKVQLIEHRH